MARLLVFLASFIFILGCENKKPVEKPVEPIRIVEVPEFKEDSAYLYIEKQLEFGYRIPGTQEHEETGDYLVDKLSSWGATVFEQKFEMDTWEGKTVPLRNIIGSFFPEKNKRILLAAHWDSRPYSDKDEEFPSKPFPAANDGGSGVGVLLEIARNLSKNTPENVGVDIIFFDGEDWGEAINSGSIAPPEGYQSWWCLGSQYWSKNKHTANYSAYYGILLDMVGAKNSKFYVEGNSQYYAPKIVDKVWGMAHKLGYSGIFIDAEKPGITDDHLFVNKDARIPMIDIVHFDPQVGYFGDYHHTQKDNIDIIDPKILKAVGSVVMNVVYYE